MEVIVPEDQLSLAIGKKGQNVRLAAKLTHWKIDIKSEEDFKKEQDEIAIAAAEALLGPRRRHEEPSLDEIPGVGAKTVEMLKTAGFTTVRAVAAGGLEELCAIPGIGAKKAEALRSAAIEMLEEELVDVSAEPAETEEVAAQPAESAEAVDEPTEDEGSPADLGTASLAEDTPAEAAEESPGLESEPLALQTASGGVTENGSTEDAGSTADEEGQAPVPDTAPRED